MCLESPSLGRRGSPGADASTELCPLPARGCAAQPSTTNLPQTTQLYRHNVPETVVHTTYLSRSCECVISDLTPGAKSRARAKSRAMSRALTIYGRRGHVRTNQPTTPRPRRAHSVCGIGVAPRGGRTAPCARLCPLWFGTRAQPPGGSPRLAYGRGWVHGTGVGPITARASAGSAWETRRG